MGALSPVTVTGQTTERAFNPRSNADGTAVLVASGSVPLADERLTISYSTTAAGQRKSVFRLTLPTVVMVDGKPTISNTNYVNLTFSCSELSSDVSRIDALVLARALLNNAIASDLIVERESIW